MAFVSCKPRQFRTCQQVATPSKEAIRKYISERLANYYHVDPDALAEDAFSHFGGVPLYAEVPDIFYDVIEEMIQ